MPGRYRSVMVLACQFPSLSACTAWHQVGPTPAEYVASMHPKRVRLHLADSSRVDVAAPRVAGDSLYGTPADTPGRERAIPLADVRSASVRKFSLGRTAGLTGVVVGGFIVGGLIDCASSDKNFC